MTCMFEWTASALYMYVLCIIFTFSHSTVVEGKFAHKHKSSPKSRISINHFIAHNDHFNLRLCHSIEPYSSYYSLRNFNSINAFKKE